MKLRVDSPFIQAGIKLTNLLILNLYWIIGCLPLVTIGASTAAAFTVTLKMTEDREEAGVTRAFWSAYRRNLRHGVPLSLILLAGIYAVWMNWQCFDKLEGNPIGFLFLAVLGVLLLTVHFLYIFPLEARYENGLFTALSNARNIFIRYIGRTLGLVGVLFLQFLFFTQVSGFITYLGFFCLPILMIYTVSQVSMPLFRRIEKGGGDDSFEITSDLY